MLSLNKNITMSKRLFLLLFTIGFCFSIYSQGFVSPTSSSQADFLKTYKLALLKSNADFRFSGNIDSVLFPKYGEFSVYWAKTGTNKGAFIFPEGVPTAYNSISATSYNRYDWQSEQHYALQFKKSHKSIAVFKSSIFFNQSSVSWEAQYFKKTFDSYLFNDMYFFTDEQQLLSQGLSEDTKLLIIPAFTLKNNNPKYFIDSIFSVYPNIISKINSFLASGGTIYAEGNAVYFIEKLGYLVQNAVDFDNITLSNPLNNLIPITFGTSNHPLSFTKEATGNYLYAVSLPRVNAIGTEIIASTLNSNPAVFVINNTNGGKIICNLGLPTAGGNAEILRGSRQLQWTLNSIFSSFAKNIDVTRSIYNNIPVGINAGQNAIPYDKVDTFEVRIKIRNLSNASISNISIKESINGYYSFAGVVSSGVSFLLNSNELSFTGISMNANEEKIITYLLKTPELNTITHTEVDSFIWGQSYIPASSAKVEYVEPYGKTIYKKYCNFTDIMFSANLVADTDLNWKNFLGLYYQPFKVFMIMENKERTEAQETKYVQYIPKDVPFYWVDGSLNIPILRTPGGKYVDVLKGSNDQNNPDFDMDSDGHPDVWLDTASIYPKGYTLTEEMVYWQNPWHRLATGDSIPYFEDIDHDGVRAVDTNNDGIVDVEEPGDKIRAWKVSWDIGIVAGYQFYDPYCSYEIWVDPPDLVPMSAGVGHAYARLNDSIPGMFYPYSPSVSLANLADTTWTNWMERDSLGNVVWKQLIYQRINNYEGFTFIDTAAQHYVLLPTDSCVGTVPQPRREFIAVLSLGGEEIDMNSPVPVRSNYSNLEYKTIFNQNKKTPIRSTYTYYVPLPNPLQFEYLTNNFLITDTLGNTLQELPNKGKANIAYEIDASTEYSYYWIRNVGHDVDYNDPSLAAEGIAELGDGVFGYFIYDIPKGMGGYSITLPMLNDSTYDINSIVKIDGQNFQPWINNPNTANEIKVLEDAFAFHIYIPQLLIPPALDDDNLDGIDDWFDDRGDRFHSQTGYFHDAYMTGIGEDYPVGTPHVYPHTDEEMAGYVDAGWSSGNDNTYGDDFFENLGKTHISIRALYEGKGREGSLDISKGGWLVVEEIFGGSPWVIFSHTLSAFAKGVNIELKSEANPSVVRYGLDTICIKHSIEDVNEPHLFDGNFDPYFVSYGYSESTITTYAGGKGPCSLISPSNRLSTIIDPSVDHTTLTLVPLADHSNPDLVNYPRTVNGSFVEVVITVTNGTDDNWINTTIAPIISSSLGSTNVVMSYVAYPRPLVPAVADPITGEVLHTGDQIGSFSAGWRFNQPDQEVLVKMGNTLNLMQPSRKAYFVFLISVDEALNNGIYTIDFAINGTKMHYTGANHGTIGYKVPPMMFSIADKTPNGTVLEYQKMVIGDAALEELTTFNKPEFRGLQNSKWSVNDVNHTDFSTLSANLPTVYNSSSLTESINLSSFRHFPSPDTAKIFILEQAEINSFSRPYDFYITNKQKLTFNTSTASYYTLSDSIMVTPIGPIILVNKNIYSINGVRINEFDTLYIAPDKDLDIKVLVQSLNIGNDIALNTHLGIVTGSLFSCNTDSLPTFCSYAASIIDAATSTYLPGEGKEFFIHLKLSNRVCDSLFYLMNVISSINVSYTGQSTSEIFRYTDTAALIYPAFDLKTISLFSDRNLLTKGETIHLMAKACNGGMPAENVVFTIYSLIQNDSVVIAKKHFSNINARQVLSFDTLFVVPDASNKITFGAKIDADNQYCEICENNNTKKLTIPMKGIPWIDNVAVTPNPATTYALINYELGKDMKRVYIKIYTVDGKTISMINNCPVSMGKHSVTWNPNENVAGSYYFTIYGIDREGYTKDYTDKFICN